MSRISRNSLKNRNAVQFFHCNARFVRKSFLCGVDESTGVDYSYRRDWIRSMLETFAGLFSVDIVSYAVLSNHLHVVARTRPDIAKQFTDREIARRWKTICLSARRAGLEAAIPTADELEELLSNPKKLDKARKRLADVSWFFGKLCEWVGRAVNLEEKTTGRCWEGRFDSPRLENLAAALLCCLYADLNLIRAGMAETPETSRHTSAYDRTQGLGDGASSEPSNHPADGWLAPIHWVEAPANAPPDKPSPGGRRASDMGVFPMSREQYLQILDSVGRVIREGKRGAIPAEAPPLLERVGIRPEAAVDAVANFGDGFAQIVGDVHELAAAARDTNRRWLVGVTRAENIFLERELDA